MTDPQLLLVALAPTATGLASIAVSVMFNSQLGTRLAAIETRLLTIEADLRQFYRDLGKQEGRLEALERHP